jgi:hypothetical protein
LAAMMISKSPSLYGFRDISQYEILNYDLVMAPGGLDLRELSEKLGVTHKSLTDLNSELTLGYIPNQVRNHMIRIPKGSLAFVTNYFQKKFGP